MVLKTLIFNNVMINKLHMLYLPWCC